MDEPFNPYVEWLGLTESTVKPDHYRLLGLPPFESDARRITSACDGMLAKVRGNRPGPHVREWQALLDELTAARNCLLNDETRTKYDTLLREGDEPATSPAPANTPSGNSGGGASYMWPPGFVPPAPKTQPAPVGSTTSVSPHNGQPAASANETAPPNVPHSGQSSTIGYPAPSAVPVLSPVAPNPAPSALPVSNQMPLATETTYSGNSASSPPVTSPAPAWSQPVSQPTSDTYGNYSSTGYPNSNYPSAAMPLASPLQNGNSAPFPPASYGMQGADPMAPVASPLGSSTGAPLAQPIAGYGQAAPVAYPAGGYGPSYSQPQMQPGGMNYSSPAAPAMPASGLPIAGMSPAGMAYPAMPATGMPIAAPMGMNSVQAMPARAAMPVQAISTPAPESELGLKVPNSSTTKAYKQSRKKNSVSTAIAALLAASLLVVAAFFVAIKDGGFLAQKQNLPRDAKELPIPTNVPPPVDPYASPPTNVILAPLAEVDKKTNPANEKPRRPKIGPLIEEEQTPESMPLIGPEKTNTDTPESVIPPTTEPPTMKPEETTPVTTASPKETAAVRTALGKAIVAMGFRDWDTAKDKLDEAKALATDELLKEKVEAVESVSTGAQEFWRAVRESTKSLGAGQELVIGNTRVAVVEASDSLLILRVGGANKRYPINDLPMGLARTLASTWFDNNAASTKVFTGAFLFVEPNGDPAEVRQLWQSAKQEGVNMDLLMPLLDDDLKAEAKDDRDKS